MMCSINVENTVTMQTITLRHDKSHQIKDVSHCALIHSQLPFDVCINTVARRRFSISMKSMNNNNKRKDGKLFNKWLCTLWVFTTHFQCLVTSREFIIFILSVCFSSRSMIIYLFHDNRTEYSHTSFELYFGLHAYEYLIFTFVVVVVHCCTSDFLSQFCSHLFPFLLFSFAVSRE